MQTPTRTSRRAVDRSERPDRQQDILLAAEKLFAQHGYRAVSIRQIAEEAGVPLALVSYYHGQKHELFKAIFDHWRPTVDERLALLVQALQGPPDAAMLRRVVEALVLPVLRLRASVEGEYYAQLVARELFYRTPEAATVLAEHFDPMAHAFIDGLHQACPGSTRAQSGLGLPVRHWRLAAPHQRRAGRAPVPGPEPARQRAGGPGAD